MKVKLIRIICIAVFLFSAYKVFLYFYSYMETEKELGHIQTLYIESEKKVPVEEFKTISNKFIDLQKINSNIVGWIRLDDSKLNNPVLQTDNNEFYLHHNYLNEKSRAGSVFMDFRNNANSLHTIFYGHVMKNGAMFGELAKFANQKYVESHPYFTYETARQNYRLDVFAAYETTTDFYYIETNFTDETYAQFIATIQEKSIIHTPVQVTAQDRIMTLSTCTTSSKDSERFVVHAKLVEVQ